MIPLDCVQYNIYIYQYSLLDLVKGPPFSLLEKAHAN